MFDGNGFEFDVAAESAVVQIAERLIHARLPHERGKGGRFCRNENGQFVRLSGDQTSGQIQRAPGECECSRLFPVDKDGSDALQHVDQQTDPPSVPGRGNCDRSAVPRLPDLLLLRHPTDFPGKIDDIVVGPRPHRSLRQLRERGGHLEISPPGTGRGNGGRIRLTEDREEAPESVQRHFFPHRSHGPFGVLQGEEHLVGGAVRRGQIADVPGAVGNQTDLLQFDRARLPVVGGNDVDERRSGRNLEIPFAEGPVVRSREGEGLQPWSDPFSVPVDEHQIQPGIFPSLVAADAVPGPGHHAQEQNFCLFRKGDPVADHPTSSGDSETRTILRKTHFDPLRKTPFQSFAIQKILAGNGHKNQHCQYGGQQTDHFGNLLFLSVPLLFSFILHEKRKEGKRKNSCFLVKKF